MTLGMLRMSLAFCGGSWLMFDIESAEIGRAERVLFKVAEIVCCLLFVGFLFLSVVLLSKFIVWALF